MALPLLENAFPIWLFGILLRGKRSPKCDFELRLTMGNLVCNKFIFLAIIKNVVRVDAIV